MTDTTIIALGGGGFSMESSPLLDDYILRASGKARPRICFVPTASGDSDNYVLRFYRRFAAADCVATDLQLMRRTVVDLDAFAAAQDIIYVGGGNTANMLAIWRAHGFDRAVRRAWSAGTVLAGISAGSICWFEHGITDSFGPGLRPLPCLGFLTGSNCPHYDGEAERRPAYQGAVRDGLVAGYAADDGAALHFRNGSLREVVSSRPGAKGYRVESTAGVVVETALATRFLGGVAG
jgi:peptidase E